MYVQRDVLYTNTISLSQQFKFSRKGHLNWIIAN